MNELFNRRCYIDRSLEIDPGWDDDFFVCSEISPTHHSAEDILLRDMWNLELHKNPDFVEDTADQAKQEMKMENTLKKLQKEHTGDKKNHHFVASLWLVVGSKCRWSTCTAMEDPCNGNTRGWLMDDVSWIVTPIFSPEIPGKKLNTNYSPEYLKTTWCFEKG